MFLRHGVQAGTGTFDEIRERFPDFDRQARAFYYARVIEIPTPRWTAYDAERFAIQVAKDVPMTTTERAYTSPIWYTPEN